MSCSKEYLFYILDQLFDLEEITYRKMMGEYIIDYHGKIAVYLWEKRFLIKPLPSAMKLLNEIIYEVPQEGAKEMLLVREVDNKELLTKRQE